MTRARLVGVAPGKGDHVETIDIGNLHFHFLSYSSLSVQHHEFLDVFASNGPSWFSKCGSREPTVGCTCRTCTFSQVGSHAGCA
eukprot:symbB.v1.2.011123.t1/scaffold739.1/size166688/14